MCSVGNEDDNEYFQPNLDLVQTRKCDKCNKCKNSIPIVLLRKKDAYCKECFLNGTFHKFKSFIGKHHLIKPNDSSLVVFENGFPSICLLHLLRSGLDLKTPKKLQFQPIFIYIINDNCSLNVLQNIEELVQCFHFKLYFVSFDEYVSGEKNLSEILYSSFKSFANKTLDEKLVVENKSETFKRTYEGIYKQKILTDVAKVLGCKIVFIPHISVNVAADILTSISLGRGASLSFDAGICDKRDSEVAIIRPLRYFDMKEVVFYCIFNNIEPIVFVTDLIHKQNSNSLHYLMEEFVSQLQINFPATVTTVLRTGDKLTVDKNNLQNKKCNLCKVPIESQTTNDQLNSEIATEFSKCISTKFQTEKKDMLIDGFRKDENFSFCFSCKKIANLINNK